MEPTKPQPHRKTQNFPLGIWEKINTTIAKFLILSVCICSSLQLKRFKEENLSVGFGSATMALEQAIEKTTANMKWVTENKAEVQRWFAQESTWEHQKPPQSFFQYWQWYVINENHYNQRKQQKPFLLTNAEGLFNCCHTIAHLTSALVQGKGRDQDSVFVFYIFYIISWSLSWFILLPKAVNLM